VLPVIAVMGAALATAMNRTPTSPRAPGLSLWVDSDRGTGAFSSEEGERFSLLDTVCFSVRT
jgi:hypothetical protein